MSGDNPYSGSGELKTRGQVLIAEDSPHTRQIFLYLFRQNGFEVSVFKNGLEAWNYMTNNEIPNLRLLFSDVMMPAMSGIDLVEKMRGNETYKFTPVVLITAVTDRDVILKAKALDVKAYLLKPVSASKIIQCLVKVFPNEKFIEVNSQGRS